MESKDNEILILMLNSDVIFKDHDDIKAKLDQVKERQKQFLANATQVKHEWDQLKSLQLSRNLQVEAQVRTGREELRNTTDLLAQVSQVSCNTTSVLLQVPNRSVQRAIWFWELTRFDNGIGLPISLYIWKIRVWEFCCKPLAGLNLSYFSND